MFKRFGKLAKSKRAVSKSMIFIIIEISGITFFIITVAIVVTVVFVASAVFEIRNVLSPTIIFQR
jgi:hypothetical protein